MSAWHWYSSAVHAYMVRADMEALFYLRRLAEHFPDTLKGQAEGRSDGASLLADLERRHKQGAFGKAAEDLPVDLAKWPVERRVAYLIQQLQEVDARQWGQPGGVDLSGDKRVAALIEIGDAAVPALIECIEKDRRLTRSVHFWRDFSNDRTVLGVREAALTAVMSILRTSVFEPVSTGDNFTARGAEGANAVTAKLRNYWKTYGHMPFDERMMAILTDEKIAPEAWRQAAHNLANLGERRTLGTTIALPLAAGRDPSMPNPVIGKFTNPTVAEAILAAMDRDLARHDAGEHDQIHDYRRRGIEAEYLDALMQLKDRSIIPALVLRLEQPTTTRMRRILANVCLVLGETRPLTLFAMEIATGRLEIPDKREPNTNDEDQPANVEITGIVHTLSQVCVQLPAADAALHALADPRHPLHPLAAGNVRRARSSRDEQLWLGHPFALRILRLDLDDVSPTGATWSIEQQGGQESLRRYVDRGFSSNSVPEPLRDPSARRDRAEARTCDEAAARISALILGAPYSHPLLKDSEQRLNALKQFLDAHLSRLRPATYAEVNAIGASGWDVHYILDVRRPIHGATARDVAEGRALFHFDGNGTPLDLKLPASATLKRDLPPGREPTEADVRAGRAAHRWQQSENKDEDPRDVIKWVVPYVLVVQAERSADGKIKYGVILEHEMRTVAADELTEIAPLETR